MTSVIRVIAMTVMMGEISHHSGESGDMKLNEMCDTAKCSIKGGV